MLQIEQDSKNEGGLIANYYGIGDVYEREGNIDSAFFYYSKALEMSVRLNSVGGMRDGYGYMASVLDKKGEHLKSYSYYKLFTRLKDSISAEEAKVNARRINEIYDLESKNAEIDLLSKEGELNAKDISFQKKTLWGLGMILSITLILAVIIFKNYRQKKKFANDLSLQNIIIEEKNSDITNSIVYAQRIQSALLPSLKQIHGVFPNSFVFYRPKDIVSGDFFWFSETQSDYYLAAVDCTGHGVPGAMMSMIGYNFLGQIVNETDLSGTAEILNELHRKVLLALNKDLTSREMKDGMDIALLRIAKNNSVIEFSGAVRPLYIVRNKKLEIIKGDLYSIGGVKDAQKESFSTHIISADDHPTFYLFSDGYSDQFGGPKGKKFKYKQLQELLLSCSGLKMEEQKKYIGESFDKWKGLLEQVDDVCMIGVQLAN